MKLKQMKKNKWLHIYPLVHLYLDLQNNFIYSSYLYETGEAEGGKNLRWESRN